MGVRLLVSFPFSGLLIYILKIRILWGYLCVCFVLVEFSPSAASFPPCHPLSLSVSFFRFACPALIKYQLVHVTNS